MKIYYVSLRFPEIETGSFVSIVKFEFRSDRPVSFAKLKDTMYSVMDKSPIGELEDIDEYTIRLCRKVAEKLDGTFMLMDDSEEILVVPKMGH